MALGSPKPRKDKLASVIIASNTQPIKLAPTIEIKLGKISTEMIRHDDSPNNSAARMNSFSRSDKV